MSSSLVLFSLLLIGLWLAQKVWKRFLAKSPLDNIPGPPSHSVFTGSFPELFRNDAWPYHRQLAEKYGRVIKIDALLGEKRLYVFDPKAMHHILVKDQDIFEETSSFIEGNLLLFGPGLLGTLGEQHRRQRKILTPVFSAAHLREMTPIFHDIGVKLRDTFGRMVEHGEREIDVLSWSSRAALEIIGQSGLGYSFDDLSSETSGNHEYAVSAKRLAPVSFALLLPRTYLYPLGKIGPAWMRRAILDILPWKPIHELKAIGDTMHKTSVEVIRSKKKALEQGDEVIAQQVGRGKDVISVLLRANLVADQADRLTEEELLAQVSTLTLAATDTTSTAISRALWVLSDNEQAQQRLRDEIVEAKNGDEALSYDDLMNLPYLDAVCRETLRLYPPASLVQRVARRDTVLPLSEPIVGADGSPITEVLVPNGTAVLVGIVSANRNPEWWGEDAYEWKPERWLNTLPKGIVNARVPAIYSNLMTFISGSRSCIGFKFAQLEMKVVLSLLIERFAFSRAEDVVWHTTGIVTPTVGGKAAMPLRVKKAKN